MYNAPVLVGFCKETTETVLGSYCSFGPNSSQYWAVMEHACSYELAPLRLPMLLQVHTC